MHSESFEKYISAALQCDGDRKYRCIEGPCVDQGKSSKSQRRVRAEDAVSTDEIHYHCATKLKKNGSQRTF